MSNLQNLKKTKKMQHVLYDHTCPFCCSIIKRLSTLIKINDISFVHLDSIKGNKLITKYNIKHKNTVIYINHKNRVFTKSIAVLNLIKLMRFPYNLIYVFNILPTFFLNLCYDFIAKNRMYIKI